MRRDPVDIVHSLGGALRTAPPGAVLNVNDIATRADVHWMTAKRYLELAQFAQTVLPKMCVERVGDSVVVHIDKNPAIGSLQVSERVLSYLAFFKAGTKATAVRLPTDLEGVTKDLEAKKLIKETAGHAFYLTPAGATAAVDLHEPLALELDAMSPPDRYGAPGPGALSNKEFQAQLDAMLEQLQSLVVQLVEQRVAVRGALPTFAPQETPHVELRHGRAHARLRMPWSRMEDRGTPVPLSA